MIRPLVALAILATPLLAQDFSSPVPAPVTPTPAPAVDNRNAVLRGINQLYLEVAVTDGGRPEDADLRSELRDVIELELRRAGILLRDGAGTDPALRSPTLRLEVKFDRGAGRFAARLNLGVSDQVTVTRNREVLLAEVWSVERSTSAAVDTALPREVRQKARDMTTDFIAALRKTNSGR
jgi:hypothetical protein